MVRAKHAETQRRSGGICQTYGMKIEVWLDGPRGGTGASPNIIKGQMGMHLEYAIPLIHDRLVRDGLRNHVKFIASGGPARMKTSSKQWRSARTA
ncbi:MAG: glutamate synthase-related protein [Calditrichia bacterium]